MGNQQPTAGSSKTEKNFRFSPTARTFLRGERYRVFEPDVAVTGVHVSDYFHNTNKLPKKREREQLIAHLKELGDTEVNDVRINNWFREARKKERTRSPLPFPTSETDPPKTKWVDAHHETRKS
jgi:hypothetical protein